MPNNGSTTKYPSLLTVDDALSSILALLPKTGIKTLQIEDALGYRLADDLRASLTLPPQPVSAMDGYAVRQSDVFELPAKLICVAESAAGHPWHGQIKPGEAVRVFTGAAIPDGADTIAIQEDVDSLAEENGATIIVRGAEKAGHYIRPAGLDVTAGTVILEAGRLLSARAIGLAVAAGLTMAKVHDRPRVAVLSTGDELVAPGEAPGAGQIISSNASFLCAFVESCGAIPVNLGIAPDRPGAMLDAVRSSSRPDLVVTTGGASVGNHDHIVSDLNSAAKQGQSALNFWKIAMRPGKPLISGYVDNIPLIGLPGNPVSTAICALIFLGPAIAQMCGGRVTQTQFLVPLASDMGQNDQRQDYIRARLEETPNGQIVRPAPRQDSSMMSVLANSNALIVRPPYDPPRMAGDHVAVLPIPALF